MDNLADVPALRTFGLILSFVVGGMVGSFLNVCIYRLPREESIVKPRSRCPKCGNPIAWFDNIPIVSWLLLGARCRQCGAAISWQYPLVEAVTGTLFLLVFWRFGFTPASPIYMVFVAGLVLVTFVDLAEWIIPDEVTLPGIGVGLAFSLVGMYFPESGIVVNDVFDALIGAAAGFGVLYLLDKGSLLLLKKRGMGLGDAKLLAMLGAFLGWKNVILIIMAASLVGSIVGITLVIIRKQKSVVEEPGAEGEGRKGHYLPFGPYLAFAGLLALFFGNDLINFYLNRLTDVAPPSMPGL